MAGSFAVYGGWQIYLLDIPSLGARRREPPGRDRSDRSASTRPSVAGQAIEIDWARLVANDAQGMRTITWSGGGAVDIYLDTDTYEAQRHARTDREERDDAVEGRHRRLVRVPAGRAASGQLLRRDARRGHDDGPEVLVRLLPGRRRADAAVHEPVSGRQLRRLRHDAARQRVGHGQRRRRRLHRQRVVAAHREPERRIAVRHGARRAARLPGDAGLSGDPILYLLAGHLRGASRPIDPARYRIATIEMGLPADRNINGGSIARIVWRQKGETAETVSEDIIVNHRSGANVLDTISVDMKTLPIEPGAGSPSHTGWVGTIDEFRVDPHEFTPSTEFWVRRVKLAALERAGSSYRIAWTYDAQNSGATLSLWYDLDGSGFDGTRIVDGVSPGAGAYTWNTAGLVPGQEYLIYQRLTDSTGRVVSQAYAPWPIVGGGSAAPAPAPAPLQAQPAGHVARPAGERVDRRAAVRDHGMGP